MPHQFTTNGMESDTAELISLW